VEPSNGSIQQSSEVDALNSKLQYDFAAQLQAQALLDNQADARAHRALVQRSAEDAQLVKHLANVAALATDQTGQSENQNLVKPTPNTVADDNAAVASGAVDSAIADGALGNVTAQLSALTVQVDALAALVAQFVTNAGNASAPAAKS
jgi:hypothetical protein